MVELINGNWNQTIAYLLEELTYLVTSGNTDNQLILQKLDELNQIIQTYTSATTEVTITDIINLPPKQITVVDYTFAPHPKPIIKYKQQTVIPPPIVKNINLKQVYLSQCGMYDTNNSRYIECTKCVDKWLAENNNVRPTKNIGCCKCKKSNNVIKPNGVYRRR